MSGSVWREGFFGSVGSVSEFARARLKAVPHSGWVASAPTVRWSERIGLASSVLWIYGKRFRVCAGKAEGRAPQWVGRFSAHRAMA
ncbi:hypothetical protein [Puniceicoccus vermicola]|uniref:Uncharacterized protein n=1 Tax=Puniceicoccus vermicola TaxID=388746 RepID=A0A7X1AUX6_9BACT|nr:hypothetical protein [Puniceicoccus vermicola]